MAPQQATTSTSMAANEELAAGTDRNKSFHLRWSRLTKTVRVGSTEAGLLGGGSISQSLTRRKQDEQTKIILNSVSGYAAPGELLSIMGPSGKWLSVHVVLSRNTCLMLNAESSLAQEVERPP